MALQGYHISQCSPWFVSGDFARSFTSFINLKDDVYILYGTDDPTSVAKDAPRGSLYIKTSSTVSVYQKTDNGSSTNWTTIAGGGNSFATMQTPSGTSPVADSSSDTLTFATDGTVSITGDSSADSITFAARVASGSTTGIVSATTQTFSGVKTFTNGVTLTTTAPLTFGEGGNLVFGTTTGTKIGTGTGQKIAFYNSTPIVKPSGDIATALTNLGLISSPTLAGSSVNGFTEQYIAFGSPTGTLTQQTSGFFRWSPTFRSLAVNVSGGADPVAAIHVISGSSYTIGTVTTLTATAVSAVNASTPTGSDITSTPVTISPSDVTVDTVNFIDTGSGTFTEDGSTPTVSAYAYTTVSGVTYKTSFGSTVTPGTDDTGLGSYNVSVTVNAQPSGVTGVILKLVLNSNTYYKDISSSTGTFSFTSSDVTSDPGSSYVPAFLSTASSRNYRARAYATSITGTAYYSANFNYTLTEPSAGEYYVAKHECFSVPAGNGSTVTTLKIFGANDGSTSFTHSFNITPSGVTYEAPNYWGTTFTGNTTETPTTWGYTGSGQTIRYRVRGYQEIRDNSNLFASSTTQSNNLTIPNDSLQYYVNLNFSGAPTSTAPLTSVTDASYYIERSTDNGATYPKYSILSSGTALTTGDLYIEDPNTSLTTGTYTATPTSFQPSAFLSSNTTNSTKPWSASAGYELPALFASTAGNQYAGFEIKNANSRVFMFYGISSNGYVGFAGTLIFETLTGIQAFSINNTGQATVGSTSTPFIFNVAGTSAKTSSALLYVNGGSDVVNIGATTGAASLFNIVGHSSIGSSALAGVRAGSGQTGPLFRFADSSSSTIGDISVGGLWLGPDGSASAPALSFINDTNTGVYRSAADTIGITTGGTLRLSLSTSTLTFSDAINIATNTSTGTKIGTSTSQKISLWNATPIVQPTTGVASATRTGGGGTTVTDTDTFDGYTIGQVVKALRNIGALA